MASTPIKRDELLKKIKADFRSRDSAYDAKRDTASLRLANLGLLVNAHFQPVSEQIVLEAQWLINYTDDWPRAAATLDRLQSSLGVPQQPLVQDPDGSWGPGCREWYRKLEPTVDALQRDEVAGQTLLPLAFMKRLEDPSFVISYLDGLRISRIRLTGRNNRDELGAVMTALSQLIFKPKLQDVLKKHPELKFNVSPELTKAYTDYIFEKMQNADTGYWGPSYAFPEGTIDVQDLSFTFHVVHYYEQNAGEKVVPKLDKIGLTTLATRDFQYPNGWRPGALGSKPCFSDHHDYDVVTLFKNAWQGIDEAVHQQTRPELQKLLNWCLTTSLQGDQFTPSDGMTTVDSYYYGVRFLEVVGFWKPADAFWPKGPLPVPRDAPQPRALAQRLLNKFVNGGVDDGSESAEETKRILNAALASA